MTDDLTDHDRRRPVASRFCALAAWAALGGGIWLSAGQTLWADDANVLGLPAQAIKNAGKLMICGGGQMPADVYSEFVRLAAGQKAKIVVIPTAKAWPNREAMEGRFAVWREMPLSSLDFLDTESRDVANQDDFTRPLEDATGVWIAGGSQGRLADIYGGTKVEQALRGVLERGGIIGGTSAGAAIMSRMMIRYGSPKAVVDAGFNLLTMAVVDQHFLRRNRQERLLGVLNEHPEMIGLGIDEGTALVVEGDHLRVMGQSEVVVCKSAGDEAPWVQTLKAGEEVDLIYPHTHTPDVLVLEHRRPEPSPTGTNPPE
ncbi:MAG TPA: cyanophycinase [Pirellulales bacterium]|jgi:cyanophycinase|nr:cyanophycinase [Pirellulales bacterium]